MSLTKRIGTVDKKARKTEEFEWKITNFFKAVEDKKYKYYDSPNFTFANSTWHLRLFPKQPIDPFFIGIYLTGEQQRDYSVEYSYGLKKMGGGVEKLITGILDRDDEWSKPCNYMKLSKLMQRRSQLVPSNSLTVTCTLKCETSDSTESKLVCEPKCKKLKNFHRLSQNFKDLFVVKNNCDTTLIVKDKKYKVHKVVLIARSPVFAEAFRHKESELQTDVLNIDDCDPDSFHEFLEFLYCGQLETISFSSALHLYNTSDKYEVLDLKMFCIDYLMENLTVENVCQVIAMAAEYDDTKLFAAAQAFFNKNLSQIFETSEWECLLENNSRLANKLLKQMVKLKIVY